MEDHYKVNLAIDDIKLSLTFNEFLFDDIMEKVNASQELSYLFEWEGIDWDDFIDKIRNHLYDMKSVFDLIRQELTEINTVPHTTHIISHTNTIVDSLKVLDEYRDGLYKLLDDAKGTYPDYFSGSPIRLFMIDLANFLLNLDISTDGLYDNLIVINDLYSNKPELSSDTSDNSILMEFTKNTGEIIEIMESTSDTNNFLDKMIKHIESLMSAENKIIEEAEKIIAVAHTRWLSENHLPGLYRHERRSTH